MIPSIVMHLRSGQAVCGACVYASRLPPMGAAVDRDQP
jgi:hypothetical protein